MSTTNPCPQEPHLHIILNPDMRFKASLGQVTSLLPQLPLWMSSHQAFSRGSGLQHSRQCFPGVSHAGVMGLELNLHPCTPRGQAGGAPVFPEAVFPAQSQQGCGAGSSLPAQASVNCLPDTQAGAQRSSGEQPGHRETEPCFNPAVTCRGPFPMGTPAPMCPGR